MQVMVLWYVLYSKSLMNFDTLDSRYLLLPFRYYNH